MKARVLLLIGVAMGFAGCGGSSTGATGGSTGTGGLSGSGGGAGLRGSTGSGGASGSAGRGGSAGQGGAAGSAGAHGGAGGGANTGGTGGGGGSAGGSGHGGAGGGANTGGTGGTGGGSGGASGHGGAGGNANAGGASGTGGSAGAGAQAGAGGAAGGRGGGSGAGGIGGASCGRPAHTYTFTRQDVRPLDVGSLNVGLVLLQTDGTPTLLYVAENSAQYQRVWAAHLPTTSDGGVSVSLAYQISRGELGGYVTGVPLVQTARSGEIRVAYKEQYNAVYSARYVTWNGDFNQTPSDVTVGSYNLTSYEPIGFALDGQDHPAIVTFPMDNSVLLATNDGSGWQTATIGTEITQVDAAALAFDVNGVASIFWDGEGFGGEPSGFVVTNKSASGWSSTQFDPNMQGATSLIAGRDGLGQVEVFYYSYPSDLRATGTAAAWKLGASVPALTDGFGDVTSVAFGAGGEIHVAYIDTNREVSYAYFDGCSWSIQVVDSDVTVGDNPQIALDSSGAPHFSYQSRSILAQVNAAAGELWYTSPAP